MQPKEEQIKSWKKNITLFLTSQSISLFGSSLVQYAIIWYITLTTKSGVMMTISTICGFLPQLLISFFGGVWADRYNKKYMIAIADVSIAVATLIVAVLFVLGIESIWILFIVLAIRSFGSGVQTPTVNAIIPNLAPQEKLMKVNGINTTIQSIMLILSPAAARCFNAYYTNWIYFIYRCNNGYNWSGDFYNRSKIYSYQLRRNESKRIFSCYCRRVNLCKKSQIYQKIFRILRHHIRINSTNTEY